MVDEPADIRPGQRWILPGGEEVLVNALDGDQVDGTMIVSGTLAVWIKSRRDLRDATLIAPVFRVRIVGAGDERAWSVAELAGAIAHRSMGPGGCAYFIDVAAPDETLALERVCERCSLDPRFAVARATVVSPDAPLGS